MADTPRNTGAPAALSLASRPLDSPWDRDGGSPGMLLFLGATPEAFITAWVFQCAASFERCDFLRMF